MPFKYQPQWQGPLSGRSFEKQTEDFLNGIESRVDEIDTRQTPSDATPMPPGVGSAGSALEYSRGDHSHPLQSSVSGSAGTLETPRTVSMAGEGSGSASFDGSADIAIPLAVSCTATGTTERRAIAERFADTINVKDFGAKGDGVTDDTTAIRAAFNYAGILSSAKIFFPAGTYLTGSCSMPGNIYVDASKAVFVRPLTSKTFFQNSLGISTTDGLGVNGYAGNGNIVWHGGVFQGGGQYGTSQSFQFFSFGHARNITVENAIFYDHCGNGHAIELAGVEGVRILDCSFLGFNASYMEGDTPATATTREAVQLECLVSSGFWFANYDYTPTRFVTVEGCRFAPNPDTGLPAHKVAVGGHAAARPSSGEAHIHDVSVVNNIFEGVSYSCVRAVGWENVVFSCNKNYSVARMFVLDGVLAANVNAQSGEVQTEGIACKNINISENVLYDTVSHNTYIAIESGTDFSEETNPVYYENISIANNCFYRKKTSFSTAYYGIKLTSCKYTKVTGNLFDFCVNNPIYFSGIGSGISVTNNNVVFFDKYGISVWGADGIADVSIENNTVTGNFTSDANMAQGIRVKDVDGFRITQNNAETLITDTTAAQSSQVPAIEIDGTSKNGFINGNKIKTANTYGSVYDLSVANTCENVVSGENLFNTTTYSNFVRHSVGTHSSIAVHGSFVLERENYSPAGLIVQNISKSGGPGLAEKWTQTGGGLLTFGLANLDVSQNSYLNLLALEDTANGSKPNLSPLSSGGVRLGTGTNPYDSIQANSGSISLSDERRKKNILPLEESVFRAWGKVGYKVFQLADAVAEKGASARLHIGVIAQEVDAAFASENLDACRYGLFCHDVWDEQYENVTVVDSNAVYDKDGNLTAPAVTHVERRKVQDAGDRFAIRYEEALALECAYQRWLGARRDAEIAELKGRLDSFERGS